MSRECWEEYQRGECSIGEAADGEWEAEEIDEEAEAGYDPAGIHIASHVNGKTVPCGGEIDAAGNCMKCGEAVW